jgi:primary-amine oxidase
MSHARTLLCAALLASLLPQQPSVAHGRAQGHPLEPLTASEISRVTALVKGQAGFPRGGVFPNVDLVEPPKEAVYSFKPGGPAHRRLAAASVIDPTGGAVWEATVDLAAGKVTSWRHRDGVQPMIMAVGPEYELGATLVKADLRWRKAMKDRGLTDFTKLRVDGWAAGASRGSNPRLMNWLTFYAGERRNYYSQPVEGVVVTTDLTNRRVVSVLDTGPVPLPPNSYDFDAKTIASRRKPTKPLVTRQPEGPTFELNGHEVRWQGWRFRYSYHAREGLVLRQVAYQAPGGPLRPILYRGALSEMVVPYGDPDATWNWRAAFDVGEYGLGLLASPLAKGIEVPATAVLRDEVIASPTGAPLVLPKAVGLYERDGGLLWRHYDVFSQQHNGRRERQLVLASASTVGNYDYVFQWIFHQDGTLELDAALTGILLGKGTTQKVAANASCSGCTGHQVDQHLIAPNHQHMFNYRLDLDVDGPQNTLLEMDQAPMGVGTHNPAGNGFVVMERPLVDEAQGQTELDYARNRCWRVVNPSRRNGLGHMPGYVLMPGGNTPAYVTADSPTRRRARFLDHALWATRYHSDELFAAGDYPNQAGEDSGLSRWANNRESIENNDLVLWYTMGVSHAPREEEWPMMNVHHVGFKLMPKGFFDRNPGLDVRN